MDTDPFEMDNKIENSSYQAVRREMAQRLMDHMIEVHDPLRFGASFMLPFAGTVAKRELVLPYHLNPMT